MIDLVEWRLKKARIKAVKLLGSMPLNMRRCMLDAFKKDASVNVILMSLKTGGEGLNLQVANHVFVLEPWWNPAVEAQAIQRAHRIGQTKPVRAVRFITKETIEEKMFQLQEKKQLVFDGTVDAKVEALSKLTDDDLQFLFKNRLPSTMRSVRRENMFMGARLAIWQPRVDPQWHHRGIQ